MIPGQEEAVEMLSEALLQAWVNNGLIRSGGVQAYPTHQQPEIIRQARLQARSLLGAWPKPVTAAELKALA